MIYCNLWGPTALQVTHWYRRKWSRWWSPRRTCTWSPPGHPRQWSRLWSHSTLKDDHQLLASWVIIWPVLCVVSRKTKAVRIMLIFWHLLPGRELTNWENYHNWAEQAEGRAWPLYCDNCSEKIQIQILDYTTDHGSILLHSWKIIIIIGLTLFIRICCPVSLLFPCSFCQRPVWPWSAWLLKPKLCFMSNSDKIMDQCYVFYLICLFHHRLVVRWIVIFTSIYHLSFLSTIHDTQNGARGNLFLKVRG